MKTLLQWLGWGSFSIGCAFLFVIASALLLIVIFGLLQTTHWDVVYKFVAAALLLILIGAPLGLWSSGLDD